MFWINIHFQQLLNPTVCKATKLLMHKILIAELEKMLALSHDIRNPSK